MKNSLIILLILFSTLSQAQVLGYEDLSILLSSENNSQGTARSMAMKNAFGALGSDLSSYAINPAGAAVSTNSLASITLGYGQQNIIANFYGNSIENTSRNLNLAQAGATMVYDNDEFSSNWKKFVLGININKTNNFDKNWEASGLSIPTWVNDPIDESIMYTHLTTQKYYNSVSGDQTSINFTLGAQYKDFLSLGFAINTFDVDYKDQGDLHEIANDGNGNTVTAYQSFWQETEGGGIALSAGVIVRPIQNIRLGIAYTSPVWYTLTEASNMFYEDDDDSEIGYYEVVFSNDPAPYYNNKNKVLTYEYDLRTPSKLTGSLAYVFGKSGLISADVTRKDYSKIKLNPSYEFDLENEHMANSLVSTLKLNLGTEWRIKDLSLRAGYSYEETPYLNAIDTDNIRGYAFGAGYQFGSYNIDFAYDYNEHTDYYDFYPNFDTISGAELNKNNIKFVTTFSFVF